MLYIRMLFLSLALLLTGCSSLPSLQQLGQSIQDVHKAAVQREDATTSAIVASKVGYFSYRASSLKDLPRTIAALDQACLNRSAVELYIFAADLPALQKMGVRCVQVYVSDDPSLRISDNVMLVNGVDTWVNGSMGFPSRDQMTQEIQYRRQLRRFALTAR